MGKLDLIWWVPSMIGSLGLIYSALYIFKNKLVISMGLWEFIFGCGLVMIVMIEGVKFFAKSLEESMLALNFRLDEEGTR